MNGWTNTEGMTPAGFLEQLVTRSKTIPTPDWSSDLWSITVTRDERASLLDIAARLRGLEK